MEGLDRRLLAFVGAHRFVLASQIEQFLEADHAVVGQRLDALKAERLVRSECLRDGVEALVRVTGAGLEAIGSRMPAPSFDLDGYRHEVGVVWLWVAGWQAAFGEPERVLSVREMQMLDRATGEAGGGDGRFAVPAGGEAGSGWLYPDVMLMFGWGRGAMHLVGWPHRRLDLDALFAGHRTRPEVADIVLCLTDNDSVGHRIRAAADQHGIGEKVRWQRVSGDGTGLPRAPADGSAV